MFVTLFSIFSLVWYNTVKRGVKFGREAKFNDEKVVKAIEMQDKGMTNQQIADELGVGRSTLLRYIANYKKENT